MRLPCTLLALCAITASLGAAEPTAAPVQPAAEQAAPAAARVFRDPVTGELRAPTPEEAAQRPVQAVQGARKSVRAPTMAQRADGAKVLRLNGSRRHYSRATIGAGGKIVLDCLNHPGQAQGHQGEE